MKKVNTSYFSYYLSVFLEVFKLVFEFHTSTSPSHMSALAGAPPCLQFSYAVFIAASESCSDHDPSEYVQYPLEPCLFKQSTLSDACVTKLSSSDTDQKSSPAPKATTNQPISHPIIPAIILFFIV